MIRYIFILSVIIVLTSAQLTSYLTTELLNEIKIKASNYLRNPKSLKQVYYSTQILQYFKVTPLNCNCGSIKSFLDNSRSHLDIYYGTESIKECQCPQFDISPSLKDSILLTSQKNDFNSFVSSTLALVAINFSVPSANVVFDKLKQFHQPDGLFKNELFDDSVGLFENTLLACELMSLYAKNGQKSIFKDFIDTFMQFLPSGEDETFVDPSILSCIDKIAEKKPRLSSVRLTSTASLLLSQLYSNDLYVISNALQSYAVTSSYKISPIVIKIEKNSFQLIEKDNFSIVINVYDLYGNNINKNVISFDIKSFKNSITNDVFYSGSVENGILPLIDLNPTIGRYALDISITLNERTQPISIITYLTIYDKIELSNIYFGITDTKQVSISELTEIKRINYLDKDSYIASSFDSNVIHILFNLNINKLNKPNQLLIQFYHKLSNTYTYFPFEYKHDKTNKNNFLYEVNIILSNEIETFAYHSGEYDLTILISDVIYNNYIKYNLGSMIIKLPNKILKELSLYKKSLLDTSDNTLIPLPEIKHSMRLPDKRASTFMSLIFTLLIILSLIIFILFIILIIKPNIKKLNSLSSYLFIILLISILTIYLNYWFAIKGFSFYQTIKYLCILLPITYLIGRSSIADVIELGLKGKKND